MIQTNYATLALLAGALAATVSCNQPGSAAASTSSGAANATSPASANGAAAAGDKPLAAMSGATSTVDLANRTDSDLKGKTVAFLPVAMGVTLMEAWWREIQDGAASSEMKTEIKDPNWSTQASSQALSALISEKPDVMIVHNPNVQLLAKQIEQAQKAGSYVIQVQMVSTYKTDAYVGPDWTKLGASIAKDLVKKCGQGAESPARSRLSRAS